MGEEGELYLYLLVLNPSYSYSGHRAVAVSLGYLLDETDAKKEVTIFLRSFQ